jgi:arginyl-tRNA synthetase
VSSFDALADPILAAYPELDREDLTFSVPPKLDLGDVALRTFDAARKLGMKPPEFAQALSGSVAFGDAVTAVNVAGPYANFKLNRAAFAQRIVGDVYERGAEYGSGRTGVGEKALLEHTSINPNASPHVGRARNAMIGDSLARLFRFEGYDLEVQYYVNDIGRQIAYLVLACHDPAHMTFDDMLQTYADANARAERDTEFAEAGYQLLQDIEEGKPEARDRFRAVTDLCLKGQVAVLARLGIGYDRFVRESEFVKDARLETVLDALREKGALFTDDEGRTMVDLAKLGREYEEGRYVALFRSNGSSMYFYRDLAYTMFKLERGASLNVIVLGEDHLMYMQQLELILKAAGKECPEPIYYSYILLKEGKMSTRQGQVILLSDFLDEARARAKEKVDAQCIDLDQAEREAIAEHVAVAAIRFAILRVGANKNVIFDWEQSLSFSGDTGPYVQYSCARIASILRKAGGDAPLPETFAVETDAEWALVSKIDSFGAVVQNALQQRSVAPVAQYVLELARQFTGFYHDCPVLEAPSDALRASRLGLCKATRQTLDNALHLLGIQPLDRM